MTRWIKDHSNAEAASYSVSDRHGIWTIERGNTPSYGDSADWKLYFASFKDASRQKYLMDRYDTLRDAKADAQKTYLEG